MATPTSGQRRAATWSCPSIGSRRATRSRTASCAGGSTPAATRRSTGDLTAHAGHERRTGRYRVEGDLTFRGVTRRYEDEMTLERDGRDARCVLAGERDVRRPRLRHGATAHPAAQGRARGRRWRWRSSPRRRTDMHELGLCSSIVDAVEPAGRGPARGPCPRSGWGASTTSTPRPSTSRSRWRRWVRSPRTPRPSWCCCPSPAAAARAARRPGATRSRQACPVLRRGRPRDRRRRRADPRVARVPRRRSEPSGRRRHVPRHPRPDRRAARRTTSTWPAST